MKSFRETNCVEFKRSWRDEWLKWICAFANAQGGVLYIGIDEKKREVVGVEDPQRLLEDVPNKVIASMGIAPKFSVEEREGKSVVAIEVAPASYPVSYHGEFHVRVGATKQLLVGPALTQFLLDRTGRKWDGVPLDGVAVEDLDRESFAIFRRRALETGRMAEADLNVPNKLLLEKLKLMVGGRLTRAAVLLFHPDPEKWVPSCYSKIGKFANDADLLFNDEIHGSLLVQAEKLVELLYFKYLIAPISYRDQTRIESYPYSKDAVRELVRTTPARCASPRTRRVFVTCFAPSCCAAGTRPRLRVAARLGTNFGRPAACGPLGRHRRRQGGSRLVPAAILVDSCRHPSITRRCGKGAAWTPFGPCRPIVRRVPATILPVHRAVDCTRLPESAIIYMPVQAGAHSAEGGRAPPPPRRVLEHA